MKKYFGEIAVLVLVAVTSFLVGSSLHSGQVTSASPTDQPASQSETNPVVSDIEQTLTAGSTTAETVTPSPTVTGLVNINTASTSELDTLPGIGPAYAQAIIDYRTANGPFVRPEDIQKVKGIGPKTFDKMKNRITI